MFRATTRSSKTSGIGFLAYGTTVTIKKIDLKQDVRVKQACES